MSAPKASIQSLLDEGFKPDGFGNPGDFATETSGYLARVLASAGLWAAAQVGQSTYDGAAAGTYTVDRLARAETCYAAAVLWQRRIKFIDGGALAGLQTDQYQVIQYLQKQADAAMTEAAACISEAQRITGSDAIPGSVLASGTLETGRFPSTAGAA